MSEIAVTKDFQQRMFERVRDQIGDLLTDEDLSRIVNESVRRAFFDSSVTIDRYGSQVRGEPPFIAMIRDLIDKQFRQHVKDWVKENDELLKQEVLSRLSHAFPSMLTGMIRSIVDGNTMNILNELRNKGLL